MKIMFGLIATIALSVGAFAMPASDNGASLETTILALQDEAAPAEEVADAAQEAAQDAVEDAAQDAVEEAAEVAEPPTPVEPSAPAEAPTPVEPPADVQEDVTEPPAPAAEAPEAAVEPAPIVEMPALEVQMIETPSVMSQEIIVAQPMIMDQPMMMDQPVVSDCCPTCCNSCCCCPPPAPTPTNICLVDPRGCSHQACINVPACCAGQQPDVCWRSGIFGRQIATVTWDCCGHSVKVIVTCRGKVRVRG